MFVHGSEVVLRAIISTEFAVESLQRRLPPLCTPTLYFDMLLPEWWFEGVHLDNKVLYLHHLENPEAGTPDNVYILDLYFVNFRVMLRRKTFYA